MPKPTFYELNGRMIMDVEGAPIYIGVEDVDDLSQYSWNVSARGYVTGYVKGKMISLHRHIMQCPKGMVVDHIDHNRLNNERSNLRVCTSAENNRNTKPRKDYKRDKLPMYVYWNARKEKYHAQYKGTHIGYFDTMEEAAERVDYCKNSTKNC